MVEKKRIKVGVTSTWVKKWLLTVAMFGLVLLSGCAESELEDREFPTILAVAAEADFTKEWLNGLQEGTKKVDYNHLKVILVEREFLEDEEAMAGMLALLKEDKNVPLNAYVVTTEVLQELKDAETNLEKLLGDYLEELLEHGDTVKKETYPTIGMLYQEKENRKETLFIPTISLIGEKPEVTGYEVYKRGNAIGQVESDVALLSFFIANQLEEYVLQLGVNNYIRLSDSNNQITFEQKRESNGLLKRQVVVAINCDGEVTQQRYAVDEEETRDWLQEQVVMYMRAKTVNVLERGIDITNSFKKLGKEREWYFYYMQSPDFYEEDIEIIFEVEIAWID